MILDRVHCHRENGEDMHLISFGPCSCPDDGSDVGDAGGDGGGGARGTPPAVCACGALCRLLCDDDGCGGGDDRSVVVVLHRLVRLPFWGFPRPHPLRLRRSRSRGGCSQLRSRNHCRFLLLARRLHRCPGYRPRSRNDLLYTCKTKKNFILKPV